MVIVLVRPSLGDIPSTQSLIPRGEVFQSGVTQSDIPLDEVAVSIRCDVYVRIRGGTNTRACRGYIF